jgi:6-pyruvoyltetrahydropterin/6-carboxytetrahydropterin synthase
MIELTRTVRFCVSAASPRAGLDAPAHNTYAGWPPFRGLGAHYELHITCAGDPDEPTGYLVNIRTVDESVRGVAIPIIQAHFAAAPDTHAAALLPEVVTALGSTAIGSILRRVRWSLTPFHAIEMEVAEMSRVRISQQFDFSAAHRLHVPALGDEANRSTFGKCNNPSGHGHNYRIEVAADVELGDGTGFDLADLEAIVDAEVIARFDHRHLNVDVEAFRDLNPTVEHIAKVCHDLLEGPIAARGGSLARVTVWETEKTSCTYPAGR